MAAEVKEQTLGLVEAPTCQHHWVVGAPAGAESRGVCRKCGAIKGFRNATQDFVWEEERSADLAYWSLNNAPKVLAGEANAA